MENFTAYNPVKLLFGQGVTGQMSNNLHSFGKRVLFLYGKGSIKNNGIYDEVIQELKLAGKEVYEFSGIKPNPSVTDARRAVRICSEKQIDLILAVGGGSVIDTAKAVAISAPEKLDPWEVFTRKVKPSKALPVIAVLTLAATGTEMNMFSVIQNEEINEKIGFGVPLMYPKQSYLDPAFTRTVSKEYTAFGIVDLIAHALENYFGSGEATLADRYVFSIVNEAIEIADPLLADPDNYDLRARMMWAATNALNGYTNYGRKSGDFAVHALGHSISALFDTPHGATLSIIYPAWLKFISAIVPERLVKLGEVVFNDASIDGCINGLTNLFRSLNSPVTLEEAQIVGKDREILKQLWINTKAAGYTYEISTVDYDRILSLI